MILFDSINLVSMRKAAKISQEEMALQLGISQSQISRYEQNPDDVPHGVVKKWVAVCGHISTIEGLSIGEPYREIIKQLRLMEDYAETAPPVIMNEMFENPPSAENFLAQVRQIARKPRVAICGRFDMGKTRIANTLLGGNRLPTGYQPSTSVICLIRHIFDRPTWQREDVWIMRKGFDLNQADNKDHCEEHKIIAGSFDTLERYGTHTGTGVSEDEQCYAALVYVDAPFLMSCDLLDLPGYGHSESDYLKTEFAHHLVDILIYASTAQGFLDQNDLTFITGLLKQLPAIESMRDGLDPLRNVYFLATMAKMSDDELEGILCKAANRAFKHLKESLQARCDDELVGAQITPELFRKRFFTFLVDNPIRRKLFEEDISELLNAVYPPLVRRKLDISVTQLKEVSRQYCDSWAARLTSALKEQSRAKKALEMLEKSEPDRQRRITSRKQGILAMITDSKEATRHHIDKLFSDNIAYDKVENMIRERYGDDKNEAKSLAAAYLTEQIQNKLNTFLADQSTTLAAEIKDILDDYQNSAQVVEDNELGALSVPFNAQGAFLGALAAMGTAGALSAWVAVATAGSNLGAYLLVPSVVSFLSSIGISVGGTASAVGLVAAIGGPITIFFGLVALAGVFAYALLGSSWQSRLAKKICETLKEKQFHQTISALSDKYWDDTRKSFTEAVDETERAFISNIKNLNDLVNATSRESITHLLESIQDTRDFFAGIPWRLGG